MGKWLSKGVTAGDTSGVKDIYAKLAASEHLSSGAEGTDILLFLHPSIVVKHVLVLLRSVIRLGIVLLLVASL